MEPKAWKRLSTLVLLLSLATMVNAQVAEVTTQLQNTLSTILCVIVQVLVYIAGGIAIIIIVLNGIKWTASSDDPGARKKAKEGIVHAIVGLIIVLIAITVVSLVTGAAAPTEVIIKGCGP